MSGECEKCGEHALECECVNYSLSDMIEMAKQSDHGFVWYSEKGAIQITKEGKLVPILQGPKDRILNPGWVVALKPITPPSGTVTEK